MTPQSIPDCGNSHWTSCNLDSVPLHLDSGTLNAMQKLLSAEHFGPLRSGPDLFLLSPGKTFLMSLVQEWLDTRNATLVARSLNTFVAFGALTPPSAQFLYQLCLRILSRLLLCAPFSATLYPSSQLHMTMFGRRQLPVLSPVIFCGQHLLWRASVSVFRTTVKSTVFTMNLIRALLRTIWLEYLEF